MKKAVGAALILVLAVLIYQFYQLFTYHGALEAIFAKLNQKFNSFKEENLKLQADLEYFQEPENLAKELRSRFNYKKPGEKLIIVVPPKQE